MPKSLRFALAVAAGLAAFEAAGGVLHGADDPTIVSRWKAQDVTIDGRVDEWAQLAMVPKGPMVAALNDDNALYLAIASKDATLRRTLAAGLVVWLDPSAKGNADVGLQLPGSFILPPGAKPGASVDVSAQPAPPDEIDEVDWLGPGKRRRLLTITPAFGVALASGTEGGVLAYEVQLPLAISPAHPFAVGAEAGRTIAIGLFTPDVPKATRRRDPGSSAGSMGGGYNPYNPYDPYGTGMYGGMGVANGPPPMMQSEPSPEKPPKMKLWLRLQLARKP
jgi:hypothetical protein